MLDLLYQLSQVVRVTLHDLVKGCKLERDANITASLLQCITPADLPSPYLPLTLSLPLPPTPFSPPPPPPPPQPTLPLPLSLPPYPSLSPSLTFPGLKKTLDIPKRKSSGLIPTAMNRAWQKVRGSRRASLEGRYSLYLHEQILTPLKICAP